MVKLLIENICFDGLNASLEKIVPGFSNFDVAIWRSIGLIAALIGL